MKKTGFILCVLLMGCATASQPVISEQMASISEDVSEEDTMTERLQEIFACSETTASSMLKILYQVIPGEIVNIDVHEKTASTTLVIVNDAGDAYYAKVMRGYFISKIFKDSLDGEQVYSAIR